MKKQKLIVILGPTASGKSALAIKLAKKFEGEIISADSRQVYKGLNIGSGRITKKEMAGVPHHLLDVASPRHAFSVAQYKKLAERAIENIQKRGKLPFLVGGSPLYIYTVVNNWEFPEVKPNFVLRGKLGKLSTEELFQRLKKLDPRRAQTIENQNPRRLIRALEIVLTTKKPVPLLNKNPLPYPVLFIGLKKSKEKLKNLVYIRLMARLGKNVVTSPMIKEVQNLHKGGLSFKRLEELGLEYRYIAKYLQKKLSYEEMVQQLEKAIIDFSRRQMTWFKKDSRIRWIATDTQAQSLANAFLSSQQNN